MDMIYGYERVHGYDMTIFAGQSRELVLAPWKDRRRTTLMVTAGASMVIGLLTWVLGRHLAPRRRMREVEGAHARRVERQTGALLNFASRHGAGGWSDVQVAMRDICEQACDVLGDGPSSRVEADEQRQAPLRRILRAQRQASRAGL